MCWKDASFTLRCFNNSTNSEEGEEEPVEPIWKWHKAACRKCYFEAMKGRRVKRENI